MSLFTSISPRFSRDTFGKMKKRGFESQKWNLEEYLVTNGNPVKSMYVRWVFGVVGFEVNLKKIQ